MLSLLATPENMEKCKDIPGVVALDMKTGDTFSANPGDYFLMQHTQCLKAGDLEQNELILAVQVCKWVDPITGEDIGQVSPDKMSMNDALGQTRN